MPPKPTPTAPSTISAAVKAAAAIAAQPPNKKKAVAKKSGSDMLQPIIKKPSALSISTGTKSAGDNIKFTSQQNNNTPTTNSILQKAHNLAASKQSGSGVSSSSATPNNSSSASASQQQLEKFKVGRAKIAQQELEQMDSIERAFREDTNVWVGPSNVVFPRRYHDGLKLNEDGTEKKRSGGSSSAIDNPYMTDYYGSQSQGWMYGEGYAGIGGQSWMEATSNNNNNNSPDKKMKKKKKKNKQNETTNSNKAFLMDDVTIIDNALRANGLSRDDVTPKAYACLLEQSRRYALELITDAQDYAIHAQRHTIPSLLPSDLLLAVQMSNDVNGVSSTLPTPEEISNLSSSVNRTALPPIPINCYNGVALPPVNEQLTARTYDVVNGARVTQRMMRGGDLPFVSDDLGDIIAKNGDGNNQKKKKKSGGSYGAGRGRQIVVNIKSGGGDVGATAAAAGGGDASGATSGGNLTNVTTGVSKKKGQKRTLTEL